MAVAAVLLGAGGSHAAARQSIWLHYDYMAAAPDGTAFAPDPQSIQLVVDTFAAHGIDLHIDSQHTALPYHALLDFYGSVSLSEQGCVNSGLGPADVVDFASLKQQYFHPTANHEWHYAIFGDLNDCEGSSGIADLPGDDFAVTLGGLRRNGVPITPLREGGALMHELGHNLGLQHGGDVDANWKPNYLSVMNYRFQLAGIPYASTSGSTSIAGRKLDYSEEALPTLDESHLDETRGVGATLPSDRTDITSWVNPGGPGPAALAAPASGPVDWNDNGVLETDVSVDLDSGLCQFVDPCTPTYTYEQQHGFDDWAWVRAYLAGQVNPGPKTIEHETRASEPIVTAVSPSGGPESGGNTVTIQGAHFEKTSQVSFGNALATSFAVVNDHTLSAVAPPGQGTVDLTVTAGDNPSPSVAEDEYTYLPPPVVTGVSPDHGLPGTAVTITGSNLAGVTAVHFGSSAATTLTVVDDHTLIAAAPTGVDTVAVSVSAPGGTSAPSPADTFTYTPTVTSVLPASGPPGTLLTIHGTSLAGTDEVCFGTACLAAGWTILDDNTVTVAVPSSPLLPSGSIVDITITGPGGTSPVNPADRFTITGG